MQVWKVLHTARWTYRTQKLRKKSPSAHHCTTLLGYIFATKACIDRKKNFLNSNVSSTCPHNMVNIGPLTAEISLPVWCTSANFNGFRVLASLLHRHHSTDVNQSLCGVWPSPALVQYIYIFGGCYPLTQLYQVQNSLWVQVLRTPILVFFVLHQCRHNINIPIASVLCPLLLYIVNVFKRCRHGQWITLKVI